MFYQLRSFALSWVSVRLRVLTANNYLIRDKIIKWRCHLFEFTEPFYTPLQLISLLGSRKEKIFKNKDGRKGNH